MQNTNVSVKRDTENWEVELKGEIPADVLLSYRARALKEIQRDATIAGFRPGKAPESEIIRVYGEAAILRHAAEHAIEHELPEILAAEKVLIVETPRVTTESPTAGKPLPFTARAPLAPEVKIEDYVSIAKKHPESTEGLEVSDKEYADALSHLRRERARIEKIESGTEPAKASEESRTIDEKDLPALDDDFAKSIGYESTEHFTAMVRDNMKAEKARHAKEVRRQHILDDLVASAEIKYPSKLREYEMDDMEARLKDDLERAGLKFDDYLAQVKKTRDEMRAEWKTPADKRTKIRLILSEISRREHIEPNHEELEKEVDRARKQYPSADVNILRSHIAHAMRNEATIVFLENKNADQ